MENNNKVKRKEVKYNRSKNKEVIKDTEEKKVVLTETVVCSAYDAICVGWTKMMCGVGSNPTTVFLKPKRMSRSHGYRRKI